MKNIFISILLIFCCLYSFAQLRKRTDDAGRMLYQYERVAKVVSVDSPLVELSFSFQNGEFPRAITYRQEDCDAAIEWTNTENGNFYQKGFVESLTANMKPNENVLWRFVIRKSEMPKKGIKVEKAALLILDEKGVVEKIVFEETLQK